MKFICNICKSKNVRGIFFGLNWRAIQCMNCSVVYIDSKKTENYENYHRDDQYNLSQKIFENIFLKRYKLIEKYVTKEGKVLDIGCTNGLFLDIFKKHGWDTYGVEPSKNSELAIKKGHMVNKNIFEKVNFKSNYFDLIVMNHTLEHIEDPNLFISLAYKYLKKGGILYIDVPNFNSLKSNIAKSRWPYLLPFEHVYQFSETPLRILLERNNFEVLTAKSRSGIFEYNSVILEFKISLFNMQRRLLNTILNIPYDILATILNKGDSISVISYKK